MRRLAGGGLFLILLAVLIVYFVSVGGSPTPSDNQLRPKSGSDKKYSAADSGKGEQSELKKDQATTEIGRMRGIPWTGSAGVKESVAQIAARQEQRDQQTGGVPRGIRERPEPGEDETPDPKLPGPSSGQVASKAVSRQSPEQQSATTVSTSFLGAQASESGFIPPDSMGAVGPSQVLVIVNGRIKVFDKQGNLGALDVSDSTFFASVRNGSGVSDPKVQYDRLSGRWIISEVNLESTNNRVMIAVSSGPTITDSTSFTFFSFQHNLPPPAGDTNQFADYPQMGVDKNAIYIGVNDFSGNTFANTTGFVIRKSSVLGAGPIVVTAFRGLAVGTGAGPFAPQGVSDMDPNSTQGYFIGVDNQVFSQLDIRRVSDPGGSPTISANLNVAVPSTYYPLNVPALGTSNSLDAIDDRLFEAMVSRKPDGALSLWTAHNIRVTASGVSGSTGTRTASRWYELGNLAATPSLVQVGTLFDPAASNPRYFWMPSIAANGQGNASLNSSMAGTGRFTEIASSGRLATDPLGATQPFTTSQSGSATYNLGSGSVKRWGDYSQTVVDPNDNMTFWTFQEYANATDSWGVRVIKLLAPAPATPSSAQTVAAGSPSVNTTITGTSVGGSGFFEPGADPGGPGFPNHLTASVSGGVAVNSSTYIDPTHITLNLNTTGASPSFQTVTITNPDGQSASSANLINIGLDTTSPNTLIKKHPKKHSLKSRAKFRFISTEAHSHFQCRVDKKPFVRCRSPRIYRHRRPGKHKFKVRAIDRAGNKDPSPARFRWKIIS